MTGGPGDELAELLWDHGPALRRPPPLLFQPFTCSAAGSSRSHELKHMHGLGGHDADTAPLPPEYCAGLLLSEYSSVPAAPPPPETTPRKLTPPSATEGVVNFTFFSRPLQRPQPSPAAAASHGVESTVIQAATNRLRSTPLFSEHRMAWLHPPKAPAAAKAAAAAPLVAPPLLSADNNRRPHGDKTVAVAGAQRPQPEATARPPDAEAAAVATSSVCSGNGDHRSQLKRSSCHHFAAADCSDLDLDLDLDLDDDEPAGATTRRRSAARSNKRSRTAEVHNLSERRRRDRINEKMRALQELIPNCNKIDKASMLEEAIEYLKTLQLQVQMMSMGTGLCMPLPAGPAAMHHHHLQALHHQHLHTMAHLGMGLGFAAHFPIATPPPMFGVGQGMPAAAFAHMAGFGTTTAAPAPARPGEGEHPRVTVGGVAQPQLQGDQGSGAAPEADDDEAEAGHRACRQPSRTMPGDSRPPPAGVLPRGRRMDVALNLK